MRAKCLNVKGALARRQVHANDLRSLVHISHASGDHRTALQVWVPSPKNRT